MSLFISGALFVGYGVVSLFFLRFWTKSRDRLFFIFSVAFLLLSTERVVLTFTNPENEFASYIYVIRLCAFVLLILGIAEKNRSVKARRV